MNTLQLVRKLCLNTGRDQPSTIEGVLDEDTELVLSWIVDSWIEIQDMCSRFTFMVQNKEINILQDKGSYTSADLGITDLSDWILDEMFLFDGTTYIKVLDAKHEDFIRNANYTKPLTGIPSYFSAGYDGSALELYPTPQQAYTLKTRYRNLPVVLANDTDTPAIPANLHNIIYYYALINYAVSDASPEQHQHGESRFSELFNRLDRDFCPQPFIGAKGNVRTQDATYYV